jgi:hypothetical protein
VEPGKRVLLPLRHQQLVLGIELLQPARVQQLQNL